MSVADLHVPGASRRAVCLRSVVNILLGGHGPGGASKTAVNILNEDGHFCPPLLGLLVVHPWGVGGVVKIEGQVVGRGCGSVVEAKCIESIMLDEIKISPSDNKSYYRMEARVF